jgi:hypothetical protein
MKSFHLTTLSKRDKIMQTANCDITEYMLGLHKNTNKVIIPKGTRGEVIKTNYQTQWVAFKWIDEHDDNKMFFVDKNWLS